MRSTAFITHTHLVLIFNLGSVQCERQVHLQRYAVWNQIGLAVQLVNKMLAEFQG